MNICYWQDCEFLKEALTIPWTLSTSQQPQQQIATSPDCNLPQYRHAVSHGCIQATCLSLSECHVLSNKHVALSSSAYRYQQQMYIMGSSIDKFWTFNTWACGCAWSVKAAKYMFYMSLQMQCHISQFSNKLMWIIIMYILNENIMVLFHFLGQGEGLCSFTYHHFI